MQDQRVRFGLVGAGAIAQAYGQAFEKASQARLVGIADIRFDAARAMAEVFGCAAYDSHIALCDSSFCDAVVICTPPATHKEIALSFLKQGIAVLCEKPFTLSTEEAGEMVAAAKENGALLTMASKFRYVDDVVRAKNIVASGVLGDIILFENSFTGRVDMGSRWNSDPRQSGGGVLIDNGTHSLDLVRYFLGPIAEVHVVEGKRIQSVKVEDTVRVFVRSTSGVMGTVDLSWSIDKELETFIDIYGSQGTIRVGWRGSKFRQASSKEWTAFGTGYKKVDAFKNQLENFCSALRGNEPLRINGQDAIASVKVVEAAYQSLRDANWTRVTP